MANDTAIIANTSGRTKILGEDEVAAYVRDGFLKPRYRLPEADLKQLQDMARRLIADNPHIKGEPYAHMQSPGYSHQNLQCGREWLDFMCKPSILDIVEDLIGPDIVLWSSAVFHKEAMTGGRVNYHRDSVYFPIKPLVSPNVWIAVTPSTIENGCVRYVPGSHAAREHGRHVHKPGDRLAPDVFVPDLLENAEAYEREAVPVELEAGEMVIVDAFTVHGGAPNRSAHDRTGFSVRYYPASSYYDHDNAPASHPGGEYTHFTDRPLFLVRGVDRSGRNDFSVGHKEANGGLVAT